MKRLIPFVSCIFLLLGVSSCQKPASISAPGSLTFAVDGAGQTISITVNRDWHIVSSESWCTVSPQSGKASDDPVTVTVKCQSNTSYDERKAVITIEAEEISHRIQVTQAQRDGIFSAESLLRADFQAQDLAVTAEANVDFSVTVLKGQDWIHPVSAKGLVSKDVGIHLEENRSGAVREGAVQLSRDKASATIQIKQAPWHAVLEQTAPGIYGVREEDYVYQPGVSQIASGKTAGVPFFRILNPDPPVALSVEGLPTEMTLAESVSLNVRLVTGEEGVIFQSEAPAVMLRESDALVWLLLAGDKGLIVKK